MDFIVGLPEVSCDSIYVVVDRLSNTPISFHAQIQLQWKEWRDYLLTVFGSAINSLEALLRIGVKDLLVRFGAPL